MSPTISLYPEIGPHEHGVLDVGDGNHLYWEVCGNPAGKPVVVLHGGPGSGCTSGMRRYFDPKIYQIILFDQRNCGRSRPHASNPDLDLSTNTTDHLLADMEVLRQHLDLERWMVFGGSWGTTLGLAYAQLHPDRVTEMVLFGITMTRRSEIDWLYRGVAPLFPKQWARFRDGVPEDIRDDNLVKAYHRLLNDADPAVRTKAAQDWHAWEAATLSADPNYQPGSRWLHPDFQVARARIVTHYFRNAAWLENGILLENVHKLANIPGIMVQGRLDLAAPLVTAWELAQTWPGSELVIVSGAGHASGDPGMDDALIAATDHFGQPSA